MFKVKSNFGWGWRVDGAPECPSFGTREQAQRYVELREKGFAHLPAWDSVETERLAGVFGDPNFDEWSDP